MSAKARSRTPSRRTFDLVAKSQDPSPALFIDGRQRSQDFAKCRILQYRAVLRRNEREAHHVTVGVRKAGESQRDDGEMRRTGRASVSGMPADDFGNFVPKADPLIPAEQRIPQRLRDDRAGANVRHVARDMFEDEPAITENVASFGTPTLAQAQRLRREVVCVLQSKPRRNSSKRPGINAPPRQLAVAQPDALSSIKKRQRVRLAEWPT